jgi:glucose uptake protein
MPWVPPNFTAALLCALLSAACWGSWSNAAKATTDVPFPLFYLDYSLSVFVTAVFIFLTLGERGFYQDKTEHQTWFIVAAIGAGAVFNVANVLLTAGIQRAGLAIAFPVGIGTALVLGTTLTYLIESDGENPAFLFGGVALAFVAILFQVAAAAQHKRDRAAAAELAAPFTSESYDPVTSTHPLEAGAGGAARVLEDAAAGTKFADTAPLSAEGRAAAAAARRRRDLGICATAGFFMACWAPLSALSMKTDSDGNCDGCLTPYGSSLLFTGAVAASSPLVCKLLMTFPLVGRSATFGDYARVSCYHHFLAWLGGAVWAVGTVFNLISGGKIGLALSYSIGQAAPMVATLWGILYYREFAGAGARTVLLVATMFVLYFGAIALVAMSKQE